MAVFKCKMCGSTLEINNETVLECEYCGTKQTLPRLDSEKRANLYDRANHFRRNNEFDKAMGIYEQILNEDTTDSEAYWSLVLCRYGIEYVEDPATKKRIPTVNRAQFTSVFDDEDYKSALQYADVSQKSVYEAEAKAINEIQKGILAISQKEEPFDVFICYKETDTNGRRTPDSVLATELYHELVREGYKVFFSRITLEDKLGSAYEPYIFAALNSAKVMVVLGTRPEYFNAVWVKNEWSRYLSLIKNGARKMLIPAYKDMDPYDLPEEFSHLQAQDMSKLGFMQDLIRGIKKIIGENEQNAYAVKETVVTNTTNIAPLLKRAFMFLEDGDFNSADEYCEKVLDNDPECAEAYLGKLMVELRVETKEELKNCGKPFDGSNNYQKVIRFADDKLKNELIGYLEYINTRNENSRLNSIYSNAKNVMVAAKTENAYKEAARLFEKISEYLDSSALAQTCHEKAEIARKDAILADGKAKMSGEIITNYESAINVFESISGWKDADELIEKCKQKIGEIKAKEEAERLESERQSELARKEAERIAEEERIAAEKAVKKRKTIIVIAASIVCLCIAFIVVLSTVIIPNHKYNKAVDLAKSGEDVQAFYLFSELGDYKDSDEQIRQLVNKAVEEETELFEKLDEIPTIYFSEDISLSYECALKLFEDERFETSEKYFGFCKNYKDSSSYLKYITARIAEKQNDFEKALSCYDNIPGFLDVDSRVDGVLYQYVISSSKLPIDTAIPLLERIAIKNDAVEALLNECKLADTCSGDYRCVSTTYFNKLNLSLYGASFTFYLDKGIINVDPKFSSLALNDAKVSNAEGKYTYCFESKTNNVKFWLGAKEAKIVHDMAGMKDVEFLFTR